MHLLLLPPPLLPSNSTPLNFWSVFLDIFTDTEMWSTGRSFQLRRIVMNAFVASVLPTASDLLLLLVNLMI